MFSHQLCTSGFVTSPNYPDNYPGNLQRIQTIQVGKGQILFLHFISFDLPHKWFCSTDHLTIEDGDGTTLLKRACGSSSEGKIEFGDGMKIGSLLPPNITSTSNTVRFIFKTDEDDTGWSWTRTRSGWSVTWRAVAPGWSQPFVNTNCFISSTQLHSIHK